MAIGYYMYRYVPKVNTATSVLDHGHKHYHNSHVNNATLRVAEEMSSHYSLRIVTDQTVPTPKMRTKLLLDSAFVAAS